jgi:hypothetical protein
MENGRSCTVRELHILYSSPHIISKIKSRVMRWAGPVAHMVEGRKVYKDFLIKPDGKRSLGRPSRRWEIGSEWILRILS